MNRYVLAALSFLIAGTQAWPQQGASLPIGDVFSDGGNSQTYSDQFSTSCSAGNNSPYAGMNPLSCYGVMMPTDSRGQCTGARGWRLLRKVGNTCYFCQPINPAINGIIIPLDQLNQARLQGFKCGIDQANPNCMAVCTRQSGAGPYIPPGAQSFSGSGSSPVQRGVTRGRPPLQGRVNASGDPCLPFGPGGYDYCANPAGTQPRGCDCSKRWKGGTNVAGTQEPGNGGPDDPSDSDQQSVPRNDIACGRTLAEESSRYQLETNQYEGAADALNTLHAMQHHDQCVAMLNALPPAKGTDGWTGETTPAGRLLYRYKNRLFAFCREGLDAIQSKNKVIPAGTAGSFVSLRVFVAGAGSVYGFLFPPNPADVRQGFFRPCEPGDPIY